MTRILILRPEPGAGETAARARALGLDPVSAPLFAIRPLTWVPPAVGGAEAVLLTSANAARCGGEALGAFAGLPCYAVGDATAAAARVAGFADVRVGSTDGEALVEMMAVDGIRGAFHPCGRDHIPLEHSRIAIERRIVYASVGVESLPDAAAAALRSGALPLIHSPRAAALFADLVDKAGLDRHAIAVAAISEAASAAAGDGWRAKAAADEPRDDALLELAAKLCQTAAGGGAG
ncbi:uroporphyrinogen-III synthase [Enterovirga sp. GCM10030262]|uniref:uroporphyrinogen-III synthase n=1 Tax=Enterovirga sp. GCM10030262 TaxID=3273391 RepID=UPI0036189B24